MALSGMSRSVLVAVSDLGQRVALADALAKVGFDVEAVDDGPRALLVLQRCRVDVVVLDSVEGVFVLRRLRAAHGWEPRVIVVAGDGDERARLAAFAAGADDCVSRPFSVGEVVARVQAIVRRTRPRAQVSAGEPFDVGGLLVVPAARQVFRGSQALPLTRLEFSLFVDLAGHAGIVRTREQLMASVWRDGSANPGTVTVHVRRLRLKLAHAGTPGLIETVWGLGYRLDTPTPVAHTHSPLQLLAPPTLAQAGEAPPKRSAADGIALATPQCSSCAGRF